MADKTVTVRESGGDYATLAAAVAGELAANPNLVTMDGNLTIEMQGSWSNPEIRTSALTVGGFTTDVDHQLYIRATGAARHTGKWTSTAYRLQYGGASGARVLNVTSSYVHVIGLQMDMTAAPTSGESALFYGGGQYNWFDACIGRGPGSYARSNHTAAFYSTTNAYGPIYLSNCLAYDFWSSTDTTRGYGFSFYASTVVLYVYNCTAVNCRRGFNNYTVSSCVLKNCLAQDCTNGFYAAGSTGTTNNCSDISGDAPGTDPVTGDVTFVDADADDYHLSATDSVARDAGADLSSDSYLPVTTDIDGQSRGSSYDIGADEYVVSGLSIPVAQAHYNRMRRR